MVAATHSDRGDRIMAYLREYQLREGWMPTVREISINCEIPSTSQVDYWLTKLQRARRIYREPGQSRCIRITEHV